MQQATRLDPLSLNSLLEVLPDGIAYVDEHGVICHANERLEALTGYTRDELVGQAVECSSRPGTEMPTPHSPRIRRDRPSRRAGDGWRPGLIALAPGRQGARDRGRHARRHT